MFSLTPLWLYLVRLGTLTHRDTLHVVPSSRDIRHDRFIKVVDSCPNIVIELWRCIQLIPNSNLSHA
jgi:hypothetical protein